MGGIILGLSPMPGCGFPAGAAFSHHEIVPAQQRSWRITFPGQLCFLLLGSAQQTWLAFGKENLAASLFKEDQISEDLGSFGAGCRSGDPDRVVQAADLCRRLPGAVRDGNSTVLDLVLNFYQQN